MSDWNNFEGTSGRETVCTTQHRPQKGCGRNPISVSAGVGGRQEPHAITWLNTHCHWELKGNIGRILGTREHEGIEVDGYFPHYLHVYHTSFPLGGE